MDKWFNDLMAFFHNMNIYFRLSLIAVLFILGCYCVKLVINAHYNAKKIQFKIIPILLTLIFFGLAIFISLA